MHFLRLVWFICLFSTCISWSQLTITSCNLKSLSLNIPSDSINEQFFYQFLKFNHQLSHNLSFCLLFDKIPFLDSFFGYKLKQSDSSVIATYFNQSLNLCSFLFPLYFYDPDNSSEAFNYLFTSAVILFGLLPLKYATKSLIFKTFLVSSSPVPQIYTFGILGFISGLSFPFLSNKIDADKCLTFSIKPLSTALLGQIIGSFLALLIYRENRISNYRSTLIFSYSLSGIIMGGILSSLNTYNQKDILTGILLGGWSGFLTASILDMLLRDHLSTDNRNFSIMFSLPVATSIPAIIISKHFSKMNDLTISIVEFKIRF